MIPITEQEIEKKRAELEKQEGVTVHAFAFDVAEGDQCVGYVKNPNVQFKMRAFDKMMVSTTEAGQMILENFLLKDQSDPRILLTDDKNQGIHISASLECVKTIEVLRNTLKKK